MTTPSPTFRETLANILQVLALVHFFAAAFLGFIDMRQDAVQLAASSFIWLWGADRLRERAGKLVHRLAAKQKECEELERGLMQQNKFFANSEQTNRRLAAELIAEQQAHDVTRASWDLTMKLNERLLLAAEGHEPDKK